MIRKFVTFFCVLTALLCLIPNVPAQSEDKSKFVKVNLSQAEIDKIIARMAEKETEYRQALNQYGFKREATIQSIGFGGQTTGEYVRHSQFTFGDDGRRYEKVMFAPMPTLKEVQITPEDLEDLNGVNQFALEAAKINQYNFTFLGKEKIDEIDFYVFDVAPKVLPNPKKSKERFFQGRIWVDDKDYQIVVSRGKGVPEWEENKFPTVEIWRENIDGKYWFPTYSYANDKLYFEKSGSTIHIKMKLKFSEYKRGYTDVRVLDEDEVTEEPAKPQPKKPQ